MTDLLTLARAYDLPPYWDGHAVVWEPWGPDIGLHICPPPRPAPCTACGLIRPKAISWGLVAVHEDTTHKEIENRSHAPRRHLSKTGRVEMIAHKRLLAVRCTDCGHDQVYDNRTRETWDLDWRDYQACGSVAP